MFSHTIALLIYSIIFFNYYSYISSSIKYFPTFNGYGMKKIYYKKIVENKENYLMIPLFIMVTSLDGIYNGVRVDMDYILYAKSFAM